MAKKPNIVLITTHDTGRHFGCYGIPTVHTPAIDGLAAAGTRFTNYFTPAPICSASRAAAMTGRYPQSNGLMMLVHEPWDWKMHDDERHMAQILRDDGYRTVLFHFQHESMDWQRPGFEEYRARRSNGFRPSAPNVAQEAAAFFKEYAELDSDKPFYAQIGFFETHTPYDFGDVGPDTEKGIFVPPYVQNDENAQAHFAMLQGAVKQVDKAVEIILQGLDEAGLTDDTLFVFTVDHGVESVRDKAYCFDPGIGVALIMRWPNGGIPAGATFDWLESNVDFLPTVLDLIDVPTPENVEGQSFAAALMGQQDGPTRDAIFGLFQSKEQRYIRTDRYKLIRNFAAQRTPPVPAYVGAHLGTNIPKTPVAQLYDLQADPLENNNVANDPAYAEIFKELDDQLAAWLESVNDPILQGPTPTPYYKKSIADYQKQRA